MKKRRFSGVDVWRSSFGEVSSKAIFELYRQHSQCTQTEFESTSFRSMVDYLRKYEDPSYVSKDLITTSNT